MEGEGSDHLQFKPWLIQQVTSGNFMDLEWIDDEQKRVFKLPWTKKNYPHWEEHHEIFRAWAQHRAKLRNDSEGASQHISLMKSNFRTILRKCQDIEELKNFHQLGLQTGNYKVFKVLTPEEALAKKTKPKQTAPVESSDTGDIVEIISTNDTPDLQLLPDTRIPTEWIKASGNIGFHLLEMEAATKRPPSPMDEVPQRQKAKKQRSSTPEEEEEDPLFRPKEVIFVQSNEVPMETEQEVEVELDGENTEGFQILLEAAKLHADAEEPSPNILDDPDLSLLKVLDSFKIPREELYTFDMRVKYEQMDVLVSSYPEMNFGYRLHYGDHDDQRYLIRIDEPKRTQLIVDFDRHPITLPNPTSQMSAAFNTVLKNTDAGVILRSDGDFQLLGKRLCQSRVFAFTSFGDQEDDLVPLQMTREEDAPLFSYHKFFTAWCAALRNKTTLPDYNVYLAFGKKPRQRNSKVFISAKLAPKAAESLERVLISLSEGTSHSIEISGERSMDRAVRVLEQIASL